MARKVERDEHGNKLPRRTRRERFLSEMDGVIPWRRLVTLVEPHYPKPGNERPPQPLETMLRIHFLQQFFNLSDPAAEDALHDSISMARFARVKPARDANIEKPFGQIGRFSRPKRRRQMQVRTLVHDFLSGTARC